MGALRSPRRIHGKPSVLVWVLYCLALLHALLIAVWPVVHAIHISTHHHHHRHGNSFFNCQASASMSDRIPHCACAAKRMVYRASKTKSEKQPLHHHDPSTCPICQLTALLLHGYILPQAQVMVDFNSFSEPDPLPVQENPACVYINAVSSRAPPRCLKST